MKQKEIQRKTQEVKVYKKQVDKLIDELREKSDSESFDEDNEKKLELLRKKMETETLREDKKNLLTDIK